MGGTVIETESEKLIRRGREEGRKEGKAEEIIEMGQEFGLDGRNIKKILIGSLRKLKMGISINVLLLLAGSIVWILFLDTFN